MPYMNSLSLMVLKLWPCKGKVCLSQTDSQTQTGQTLDAPEFHSRGIKWVVLKMEGFCISHW